MSSIPLQIRQPQIETPLNTLGQFIQLRDAGTQIKLREAQVAQANQQTQLYQAEAQQKQHDLADQKTLQDAQADPTINAKIHTGDFSDIAGKVQPSTLQKVQAAQVELQKGLLANNKEKNTQAYDALNHINSALTGLQLMKTPDGKPDLATINASLPETIRNLSNTGAFKDARIDASKIPQVITDPSQINAFQATIGGTLAAHQQAIATQESESKATEAAAAAKIKDTQATNQSSTGLLPDEQEKAKEAAATLAQTATTAKETARHDIASEATARVHAYAAASLAQSALGDREINSLIKPHQATLKSANDQLEKINEASQMLRTNNAITQAEAVPKVFSALVSSAGSGIKVTNAELNKVFHARGLAGDAQAFLQKLTDGNALTPTQSKQLADSLDDVAKIVKQKAKIANDTIDNIQNAPDRHGRITADQIGRAHLNILQGGEDTSSSSGHKVGDTVTLKNGQTVTIKTIHPDGSFD